MIEPYFAKWHIGFGYGGKALYGFRQHYWTIGWHKVSDGSWRFNLGKIV